MAKSVKRSSLFVNRFDVQLKNRINVENSSFRWNLDASLCFCFRLYVFVHVVVRVTRSNEEICRRNFIDEINKPKLAGRIDFSLITWTLFKQRKLRKVKLYSTFEWFLPSYSCQWPLTYFLNWQFFALINEVVSTSLQTLNGIQHVYSELISVYKCWSAMSTNASVTLSEVKWFTCLKRKEVTSIS